MYLHTLAAVELATLLFGGYALRAIVSRHRARMRRMYGDDLPPEAGDEDEDGEEFGRDRRGASPSANKLSPAAVDPSMHNGVHTYGGVGGAGRGVSGVAMVEVVGLAGVGKTAVATEYCYLGYSTAAGGGSGGASPSSVSSVVLDTSSATTATAAATAISLSPSSPSSSTSSSSSSSSTNATNHYGLVVWLRAESGESLAGDLR